MSATDVVEVARVREQLRTGEARRIREGARVSAAELATTLDVHESTVLRWELGVRLPRGQVAVRYGRVLRQLAKVAK